MKVLVEPGGGGVVVVEVEVGMLDVVVVVVVVLGAKEDVVVFRLREVDVVLIGEGVDDTELVVVVDFVENGSPSAVVKPEVVSYGIISEQR